MHFYFYWGRRGESGEGEESGRKGEEILNDKEKTAI